MSTFWEDEFNENVTGYFDASGLNPFPWVRQDPMSGNVYTVLVTMDGYDEEKGAYEVLVTYSKMTEDGVEESVERKECVYESDFMAFFDELTTALMAAHLDPAPTEDFALDVYDWSQEAKDKTPEEIYEYVMKACEKSRTYYREETERTEYLEAQRKEAKEAAK